MIYQVVYPNIFLYTAFSFSLATLCAALSETLELAREDFIVLCYQKHLDEHLLRLFIFLERNLNEALSIQRLCYSSPL